MSVKQISKPSVSNPSREPEELIEATVSIPPDGGWGWVVVGASFLCNFVADGAVYTFGMFLSEISETFHTQPTTISIGSSLITGFYYCSGPLTCALVNRFGFQFTGCLGGLVASIAFFSSSLVTNVYLFLVFYGVVGGIGFGLVFVPSMIVIGFYFERWRALATSIATAGSAIGIIGFPLIIQGALGKYSWQTKFKALSGLCIIIACIALLYRPIKPTVVLTKDQKIIHVIKDDSIENVEEEERSDVVHSLYKRYHTTSTASQLPQDNATVLELSEQSSSVLLTSVPGSSSTFFIPTSKFDNKLSKLSTVYERRESKWKRWCKVLWCKYKFCRWCFGATNTNRPLYRDDIFYGASLNTLPGYSSSKMASQISKMKSIDRSRPLILEVVKEEQRPGCKLCPDAIANILKTMLNFNLLKSPSFVCLTLSNIMTLLGMYIPFIYLIEWASEKNIERKVAYNFYTALGLSNAIGRVLSGLISTFPKFKALYVSCSSLIICGVATIISYFLKDVVGHFVYISIFGLTIACFASLKTPILVDLVGLENLTNSFGLILLCQGIAGFLGMPLAAQVVKLTKSYNTCFIFAGCYITISGLLFIPVKLLSNSEKKKKGRNK